LNYGCQFEICGHLERSRTMGDKTPYKPGEVEVAIEEGLSMQKPRGGGDLSAPAPPFPREARAVTLVPERAA
jgi:hypothetical protein